MNAMRHRDLIEELTGAILRLSGEPGFEGLSDVELEEIQDSDGESALRAVLALPDPGPDGWPVDHFFIRVKRINNLAADYGLDEYVYLSLTPQGERQKGASERESAEDAAADEAIESQLRQQAHADEGER